MIIVKRSGMSRDNAAADLNVNPSHLSTLYNSEKLTDKVKRKAAEVFGLPADFWGAEGIEMLNLPEVKAALADGGGKERRQSEKEELERLRLDNARLTGENAVLERLYRDLLDKLEKK